VKLRVYYGLEAQPMTTQLLGYFGAPNGVLVMKVVENNKAALLGLRAGDVIVKVGEQDISEPGKLVQALDTSNAAQEIIVVRRREKLALKLLR
jgi:S1-C subfamily serine protease